MFVDLHIIQSFAPSNLNRDDTGAPKDCLFGNERRARISSQCVKRAIRQELKSDTALASQPTGERTRLLLAQVTDALIARGRPADSTRPVVETALSALKLGTDEDGRSEYLLFLGSDEVERLIDTVDEHWDALLAASPTDGKRAKKKSADVEKAIVSALDAVLGGSRAVDLALFGRMLADRPGDNIDAATQVAHAISTHRASVEVDFFTAVDDRSPGDETGAGMMGTVEFNAACYYRYASLDIRQLTENLGDDDELVRAAVSAFVRSSTRAVPTGKQNSFAANNPPAFIMADLRTDAPWSLANAFLSPVAARENLVQASVTALGTHFRDMTQLYATASRTWFATLADVDVSGLDEVAERAVSLPELLASVEAALA